MYTVNNKKYRLSVNIIFSAEGLFRHLLTNPILISNPEWASETIIYLDSNEKLQYLNITKGTNNENNSPQKPESWIAFVLRELSKTSGKKIKVYVLEECDWWEGLQKPILCKVYREDKLYFKFKLIEGKTADGKYFIQPNKTTTWLHAIPCTVEDLKDYLIEF